MEKVFEKLTVYFEEPFWVGVFEKSVKGKLCVCKVTFGAEPKGFEVYDFIIRRYYKLKFSNSIEGEIDNKKKINPKRAIREAKRNMLDTGIGTKAQQALKFQHEQNKLERKTKTKEKREAENQYKFELKKQKRKEKHKGR